jgi:hypothetical protein
MRLESLRTRGRNDRRAAALGRAAHWLRTAAPVATALAVLGAAAGDQASAAPAAPSVVVADASGSVRAGQVGRSAARLRVGGRSRRRAVLRFPIPDAVGPISRATLRLWTYRGSRTRLDVRALIAGDPWARGRRRGARRASFGPVAGTASASRRGGWLLVDVSRAVRSSGTLILAVAARGRGSATFAGHGVGSRAPTLLIQLAAPAGSESRPSPQTPPQTLPPPVVPALPPAPTLLSDDEAAARVSRSPFEPRPGNAAANQRVPAREDVEAYRRDAEDWRRCKGYVERVTGAFTGTTDEIIQWAALKWGLDPDIVRAEAAVETWWDQGYVGDGGASFGLMQIKRTSLLGTYPASQLSTAFNLDVYGATIRAYYDGCATWLETVPTGRAYVSGDLWGSIGAWYAGRWHNDQAEAYIARVAQDRTDRVWLSPSF